MLNYMKNNLKFFPILLLPLGCIGLTSTFQVAALLIFLYLYFLKKEIYDYMTFFKDKRIKISLIFFLVWIFGIGVSDFVVNNNLKESFNVLQRILPFILVGFFSIKCEDFFKYAWIGLCISMVIISCDVLYNFFLQEHWRPTTMFNNPNRLGGFLILLLPYIYGGFIEYKDNINLKSLGIIASLLGTISLLISGSRGAIVGFIIGSIICLFLVQYRHLGFKKALLFVSCGVLVLIIGLSMIYFIFPQIIIRSYDMERVYLWQSSINIFCDYPIFGIGKGNFNEIYLSGYMNPLAENPNLTSPHNIFLQFMTERGLVGIIPFIILLMIQINILCKSIFMSLHKINIWVCCEIIVIFGMIIHGMFDTVMNNRTYQLMYWLLYGISCYSVIFYNQFIGKVINDE